MKSKLAAATSAAAATALSATCVLALAAPAQAYDSNAYAYAAGHMINSTDIPSALGAFSPALGFNGFETRAPITLCYIRDADPTTPDTTVTFPGGRYSWNAGYSPKAATGPSISVTVTQYPTAQKSIAAFGKAKKAVKGCTGTGATSWTDPDSGVATTYSTQVTNGVVPAVSTAGVASLFVSTNNLTETAPATAGQSNDQYLVVSLIDNVIITTSYFLDSPTNITSAQRRAVNQVAFNAETAWLG